ncbi:hypothetical protein [Aliidongia dinghuensis]|uniref:hypothetical protein n=1 Tax=Aliidongia dinghuensis TaxID=1867774 RepID=UPI001E48397A|nr:hypothetical protein [Aliidongia dinghuensis]
MVGDRGFAAQIDRDDLLGLAVVEGRNDDVQQGRRGGGNGFGCLGLLGDGLSPSDTW